MSYIENINSILKPKEERTLHKPVIDVFAGCGGLSLGFEAQGFNTIGYEKVKNACDTYASNLHGVCYHQELTIDTDYQKADIVIGGPPCQPFSAFGKKLGLKDSRDGFPIFISAIKKIEPQIFV
ncbi:MAG: DNA cytosine methyltransferase, partial [Cytophagales bacterium]|nr:DNA cytosine methyltransferase [Cytophagales bacterium]